LIDAAIKGEQVVLMRRSEHVATIVPLTAADLEISPRLTDDQAARLWKRIAHEQQAGTLETFASPERAVARLSGQHRRRGTSKSTRGAR
jgi:antitoxin (DNA-binding transcriptional repressor) of toxin-antitoxin stability system